MQLPRKPIRHPAFDVAERPFIVIWEITRACDLACAHCRAEAMPLRNPDELSTDEGRALIDEVAGFGTPPPILILTGGDPMKRPDLKDLIAHAVKLRLPVALSPSGTPLLTPDVIYDLRAAGLKAMSLSVDGAEPAVHDAFRGIPGVFERTMTAWDTARKCGLKVQINTTVASLNLIHLPKIAHEVLNRGAMTWSIFPLVPMGRGTGLERISAQECEDVMNFLYDVGTVISVKTTEGHHFKRVFLERTILERRKVPCEQVMQLGPAYHALRAGLQPWPVGTHARRTPMDVNAGRGFVFVSHVGTVHPSGFLPVSAGNVHHEKLGEIYRDSKLFRDLREPVMLAGRCGMCEFSPVCGGSRSRAYALTGDPLAEDEMCNYVPGSFPFQDDVAELLAAEAQAGTQGHEAGPAGHRMAHHPH
ncbi:MAG: TIGR04053 family radical SAM/SPASM domain-containing protein [Candidatus Binataceae bacterium]|jgi:radical SAM protein